MLLPWHQGKTTADKDRQTDRHHHHVRAVSDLADFHFVGTVVVTVITIIIILLLFFSLVLSFFFGFVDSCSEIFFPFI